MKFVTSLAFLLLQGLVLGQDKKNSLECVKDYDGKSDLFPEKVKVDDSSIFKVEYFNSYKVVTNSNVNQTIVLYQCGTTKPSVPNVDQYFAIPIKKTGAYGTTAMAFLEALGVTDTIQLVSSDSSIISPCIRSSIKDKKVSVLSATNATLSEEQKTDLDIEFVDFPSKKKSPKEVAVSAVQDPGLLKRAEWIEYFSLFYNLETASQQLTSKINNNFNCYANLAKGLKDKNLKVLWVSYVAKYENTPAYYSVSAAPFKKNLIEAAGAQLIEVTNGTMISDVKVIQEALSQADAVVDESFNLDNLEAFFKTYQLDKSFNSKALQNKKVLRVDGIINPSQGFDWFESAVLNVDAVLQDFIRALYPESTLPNVKDKLWFRNLATDDKPTIVQDSDKCEPFNTKATQCSADSKLNSTGSTGNKSSAKATYFSSFALLVAIGLAAFI